LSRFFRSLPKNESRRNDWLKFVNKPNWQPNPRSVKCSKHFQEECFDRSSQSVVRLKSDALPTLLVERMKYISINLRHIKLASSISQQIAYMKSMHSDIHYSFYFFEVRIYNPETREVAQVSQSTSSSLQSIEMTSMCEESPRKLALKTNIERLATSERLKSKKIKKLQHDN
jgi:hypothetical protein